MGMTNVVVPNVALKVLSTLLKVVMIEGNWDSQSIDMTLSLAVGHMKIA
jgi:hypothetical protein